MIVVNTALCTGCRGCQTACKQWNNLTAVATNNRGSYENPPDLSSSTYVKVLFHETEVDGEVKWHFGQRRCMHCADAGCIKACPVPGAITRDANGAVVINQGLCTGCKYCVFACPFDIPRYDSGNAEGAGVDRAYKCTMCFERQSMGMEPACTKTCPTGALSFAGEAKLAGIKAGAKDRGLEVYDGGPLATNVVFLLEDSPSAYGLPAKPAIPTPTYLWRTVMKPVGVVAFFAGLIALIAHYVNVGPKVAEEETGTTAPTGEGGGDSDVSSPY